ncbi:MAG: indole-3-glycerol phosphate synthase TrpC, partial [Deltaproteobacteria bacterium]|nr:indole-3-glycerol phosphate synthase TrpC [Deltaproteobacteria bacterium]
MKGQANNGNFLGDIVTSKQREVALRKQARNADALIKIIEAGQPARSFEQAMAANEPPRIIAEIKRRSPSRGVFAGSIDIDRLAADYASAGASALSVLTDDLHFGGSIEDLVAAKRSVEIPVLRKDFIIDEFQVYESRAMGADTLLLIVRLLGSGVGTYIELSRKLGMEPLVEVHSEDDLTIALDAGSRIIGINSR